MKAERIQEIEDWRSENTALKDSVHRFMWWSLSILAIASLVVFFTFGRDVGRNIFIFTLPVIVAFTVFSRSKTGLFRRSGGGAAVRFGLANALTASRIFMVPSVLVLLVYGHILTAAILYLLILFTDIADGFIARRWNQETVFGLMLDPFGDIASTLAVFSWLWLQNEVPAWLYVILLTRYAEFFAGMFFLSTIDRVPRLQATLAGKMSGVVQGTGIMILMVQHLFPDLMPVERINYYMFPVIAAAFISVIVSQTSIGVIALRRANSRAA